MKAIYLILMVLLGFISCEMKINQVPEPTNLISKEKMALILEEIMVIENHIQNRFPHISQFQESVKSSGDLILKKHDVSFKQFEKSLEYYGARQDEMKEIYNISLESMNKKLLKLQAE
ncbi:MAG: DUF4296 domain-containing protein [Bacteroidota bacterium]